MPTSLTARPADPLLQLPRLWQLLHYMSVLKFQMIKRPCKGQTLRITQGHQIPWGGKDVKIVNCGKMACMP